MQCGNAWTLTAVDRISVERVVSLTVIAGLPQGFGLTSVL